MPRALKHSSLIALSLIGLLLAGCSDRIDETDAIVFEESITLSEAQQRSEETGQPALVFVQALWCPLCTRVREDTLEQPEVKSYVRENTVPASFSVSERRIGPEAQAELIRLDVRVVPTLVLYNGKEEIARIEGVIGPDALLEWLASQGTESTTAGATTTLALDDE